MSPVNWLSAHPLPRPRWSHQERGFLFCADQAATYLAAEQRTGKTQIVLDKADYLQSLGLISAVLVVAMPSGAPRNWMDEIATNWPSNAAPHAFLWQANKFKNKSFQANLEAFTKTNLLAVLCVNGEATVTQNFLDFIGPWLRRFNRRVLVVYDEGTLLIPAPSLERMKVAKQLRKLCNYAMVLDGTPSGEGPLDLYSQYYFLDPNIIGQRSFTAFKQRYAVLEEGYNHKTHTKYTVVKRDANGSPIYQNLNELAEKTAPVTFRVRFRDVFADVPEPVYSKRFVELTEKQQKIYRDLEDQYETEIQSLGTVSVANVLTRYLRLQQVTSGFWPNERAAAICDKCSGDGCGACDGLGVIERNIPLQRIVPFGENPRLHTLRDELGFVNVGRPAVVWCRFNQDIDDVLQLCRDLGRRPVQYDGRVPESVKAKNKAGFQDGLYDTFVAKTRSAGRAVSLSRAELMIYYSSEFGLNQRLQSEVRAETGTRTIATQIVDFVAVGTKDETILRSHRERRKLSDLILNEKSGKWI